MTLKTWLRLFSRVYFEAHPCCDVFILFNDWCSSVCVCRASSAHPPVVEMLGLFAVLGFLSNAALERHAAFEWMCIFFSLG